MANPLCKHRVGAVLCPLLLASLMGITPCSAKQTRDLTAKQTQDLAAEQTKNQRAKQTQNQTADQPRSQALPAISIVIDDLGNGLDDGLRAIALPGPVAYSLLPHTPHSRKLALIAREHNKEVLLHLPMEAKRKNRYLGPGALMSRMTRSEFIDTFQSSLADVPYAIGLNNHLGSLLTQQPTSMEWLMDAIKTRGGLFFIDSLTTPNSIAAYTAEQFNVAHLRRDIFLDHSHSPDSIRKQFRRLVQLAKYNGTALGIAHPHPGTLELLEKILPKLPRDEIRLVTVSRLLKLRQEEKYFKWRLSLYHLHRAARSSKLLQ